MSETSGGAGAIHAADMEGTRLCGAVDGLKTVFRSPGAVTCFDCLAAIAQADEPVEPDIDLATAEFCDCPLRAVVATRVDDDGAVRCAHCQRIEEVPNGGD